MQHLAFTGIYWKPSPRTDNDFTMPSRTKVLLEGGGVEYDAVVQMIAASMQKMEALGAEPETIKLCKPG